MARYVIGDVQGCYSELQLLLEQVDFVSGRDKIYLVGDLVNRGPDSLSVLRWAWREREHVTTVLGNHDLHLLARYCGVADARQGDTLDDVLTAPDAAELMAWLRKQPLLLTLDEALITHAGILPIWDESLAQCLADEVSMILSGEEYKWFLSHMYGNKPRAWSDKLDPLDRMRLTVNVFTRMRLVDDDGRLDFKFKGELEKAPAGLHPWFDHPERALADRRIVCGHWSALGFLQRDDLWAIDTGCVWGGALSAMRLEDGCLFQVAARQAYQAMGE